MTTTAGAPYLRRDTDVESVVLREHGRALSVLSAADSGPVTLAELRAAGLGAPATLIYELTLAGHRVEHVYAGGRRRRLAGFRLRQPQPASPEARPSRIRPRRA